MDKNCIISHEAARKRIYGVLSRAYCLPDERLPELTGTLAENFVHLVPTGSSYDNMLQSLKEPGELRALAVDYTRLFVGPYSPPALPYGSIYLEAERRIMGDSTMDAASRYSRFGIQTAGSFRDVPDHIAAEFEFMFFLIHREVEFLVADKYADIDKIIFEQNSFLNDHLNAWVPEFTDLVIQNALVPFYKNLARLTRLFIAWDAVYLSLVRGMEKQA